MPATPNRERLAELTWLVGYYAALALALAVFRPVLPESIASASAAGARDRGDAGLAAD